MALPVLTVANASAAITASRSPSVTFSGYVPQLNDLVLTYPSSTSTTVTPTAPSGWVNVLGGTTDVESTGHEICCFYHFVTQTEVDAGTTTFTLTNLYGATTTGDVNAAVFRNVDTTTPIDNFGSTFAASVTPHVLAAITGTGSALTWSSKVVSCVAKDTAGAYSTLPSGWAWISQSNNNQGKAMLSRLIPTTFSTNVAATNITPSAADIYASISVALTAKASGSNVLAANTTTFSYTVGADDTCLIVAVNVGNPSAGGHTAASYTTRTVTYNSVSMTSAGVINSNNGTGGFVELFYLLRPAHGANTVSVNMTKTAVTNATMSAEAWSYPNIAGVGTAVTAFGSTATASVTVTSNQTETVVAAFCAGSGMGAETDTLRGGGNYSLSNGAGCLLLQDQVGEASSVLSATITAVDNWGVVGLPLKPFPIISSERLSVAVQRAGFY